MTIESDAGFAAGLTTPAIAADGHDHARDHSQAHDSEAVARSFSPFLASVVDRLGLAVVFAGLVWIGVFWAVH